MQQNGIFWNEKVQQQLSHTLSALTEKCDQYYKEVANKAKIDLECTIVTPDSSASKVLTFISSNDTRKKSQTGWKASLPKNFGKIHLQVPDSLPHIGPILEY